MERGREAGTERRREAGTDRRRAGCEWGGGIPDFSAA